MLINTVNALLFEQTLSICTQLQVT